MEKIWGPIKGFYIAAYAIPVADGARFCSYAKVCASRPDSYWEAHSVFKIFGGEDHPTEISALGFARLVAQAQIERIPNRALSLLGFAMLDEGRQVVFPLAWALRHRAPS